MARAIFKPRPFNPVALREMKVRMRGPRTFALLAIYTVVLSGLIYIIYLQKGGTATYSYGGTFSSSNFGPTRSFETGQDLFITIFLFLLFLTAVVTPAICGGLVSREMEEGTYDMLVVTPLRGRSLIYGKLLGALSYIAILTLASAPVASIVFMFGGVELKDLLAGYAIVLMQIFVIGVISLFFSGLFKRTSLTIIVTYSMLGLLLLGVPLVSNTIVSSLNAELANRSGGPRIDARIDPAFDLPKRILVLNPFAALGSVLAPNAPVRPGLTDNLQYFPNSRLYLGDPNRYFATPNLSRDPDRQRAAELARLPILPGGITLWQGYLLTYTGIGLFFLILSFGVIKPVPRGAGISLGKVAAPVFGRLKRPGKKASPAPEMVTPIETEPEVAAPVADTEHNPPPEPDNVVQPEETPKKRVALG
jgi:ABC-2 type transport system permease protein